MMRLRWASPHPAPSRSPAASESAAVGHPSGDDGSDRAGPRRNVSAGAPIRPADTLRGERGLLLLLASEGYFFFLPPAPPPPRRPRWTFFLADRVLDCFDVL